MPCPPRKVRILIKKGKAEITSYRPFTIRLLYPTGETVQPVDIGIDTGAKHIGMAVVSVDKVLAKGEEYQDGDCKGFYDVRYFVFARDGYTCQVCKQKDKILRTHHILYTSMGGTDRADNLITVCTGCHIPGNHQPGGILYKWMKEKKKVKQYKEPPFMNALRKRVSGKYPDAHIVYGSETAVNRKMSGLEKTHYNDAIAITGIKQIRHNPVEWFGIKQFRKKKRSLHEANPRKGRKEPNRLAKRNKKNTKYSRGFYLNDQVSVFGKTGWITCFCNGGCYVKDIYGSYITRPDKTYKQIGFKDIKFINHNNNWQYAIHPTA